MAPPVPGQRRPPYIFLALGFFSLALSESLALIPFITETKSSFSLYLSAPLLCIGMCSLLLATKRKIPDVRNALPTYVKILFALLICWTLITIFRGIRPDFKTLRDMWGISIFAWALLVPVTALLGTDLRIWRSIFNYLFILGSFGVLIFLVTIMQLHRPTDFELAYGCLILVLFSPQLPLVQQFNKVIVFAGSAVTILTSVLALTRNQVFEKCLLLLFAGILYFQQEHAAKTKRRFLVLLAACGIFSLNVYIANNDTISFIPLSVNERLSEFKEKLPQNSRISGRYNLYQEFFEDMGPLDLLAGRGSMGEYRGHVGSHSQKSIDRKAIECGYLQIILNGGFIMLTLILALSFLAIWLGVWRSRNRFTKACAFIIITRLFAMVPFGLPEANIAYILFWMAIGACLSHPMRMASDAEIVAMMPLRRQGSRRRFRQP